MRPCSNRNTPDGFSVQRIKEEDATQIKTEQDYFTPSYSLGSIDTAVKVEKEEQLCWINSYWDATVIPFTSKHEEQCDIKLELDVAETPDQEEEPCDVKLELYVAETPDQCWPGEAWRILVHIDLYVDFFLFNNHISVSFYAHMCINDA